MWCCSKSFILSGTLSDLSIRSHPLSFVISLCFLHTNFWCFELPLYTRFSQKLSHLQHLLKCEQKAVEYCCLILWHLNFSKCKLTTTLVTKCIVIIVMTEPQKIHQYFQHVPSKFYYFLCNLTTTSNSNTKLKNRFSTFWVWDR